MGSSKYEDLFSTYKFTRHGSSSIVLVILLLQLWGQIVILEWYSSRSSAAFGRIAKLNNKCSGVPAGCRLQVADCQIIDDTKVTFLRWRYLSLLGRY
jgi:hypothetical protein